MGTFILIDFGESKYKNLVQPFWKLKPTLVLVSRSQTAPIDTPTSNGNSNVAQ